MNPMQSAQQFIQTMRHPPGLSGLSLVFGALHNPKTDSEKMEHRVSVLLIEDEGAAVAAILARLKGANTRGNANIFVRPDAHEHPWVLLDDLPIARLRWLSQRRAGLFVQTSADQGQAWLLASRPLYTRERHDIQSKLAAHLGADPGATGGGQFGRLPGFTNRKPRKTGQWTNLLADTTTTGQRLRASESRPHQGGGAVVSYPHSLPTTTPDVRPGLDLSRADVNTGHADGQGNDIREFAFACYQLRFRRPTPEIVAALAARALARGKRRTPQAAERYARRLVEAAAARLR